MFVSMSHAARVRTSFAIALAVSPFIQAHHCQPSHAFPFLAAKKTELHTPVETKLNSNSGSESPKYEADLQPINLTKDNRTKSNSESSGDSQLLKLHAETMGVAPKGPIDANGSSKESGTLPNKSLKLEMNNGAGTKLNDAMRVNLVPMVVAETDADAEEKELTDRDCEKAQLSDLWEATLNRNPDIQFVVQRLLPSSDKNHATTILMRLISSTLSSIASVGPLAFGQNPAAFMGSQVTSSMIYQTLGYTEAGANKRAQIDQGQAIMLYQMVRNTADKVTETYRDYKFYVREIDDSQELSLNLQNMIQDARAGQDAAKQIEMVYWVGKAKIDVKQAVYKARRYRQSLIDLAGVEAVQKLDQTFQDQFLAEKDIESKKASEITEPVKSKVPDQTREAITKLLDTVHPQR